MNEILMVMGGLYFSFILGVIIGWYSHTPTMKEAARMMANRSNTKRKASLAIRMRPFYTKPRSLYFPGEDD